MQATARISVRGAMQRAALQRGFEADVHNLLACFVAQHGDTASFEGFKHVWRSNSFSLIHEARPQTLTDEQYMQALYAAALAPLGGKSAGADVGAGASAVVGVDANDAAVLYTLLLLYHTQHCSPRVHVYLPLAKAQPLLRLLRRAAEARHGDVLRVFRVLMAEDALVLGCVEQPSAGVATAPALSAAAARLPAARAAEEHLLTPLDDTLSCDSLAALSTQYAEAAQTCGLTCAQPPLHRALHACLETLAASSREVASASMAPRSTEPLPAEVRHATVGATAGAIAAKSAALPLQERGGELRAQIDAQLAELAAGVEAPEDSGFAMPRIPGD